MIDWHANLWLPEHFDPEEKEYLARVGGQPGAAPADFEKHVAAVADQFCVVTMQFRALKLHVPNEFVADFVRKHGNRAKGFACVDPMAEDAPAKLEYAVRELGLHGLKISPVYGAFDPWCQEAARLYRLCDKLRVPLLWHQSAAYASASALEHGNPILLDKIGREFPRLRMIVAHLGQPWMGETVVLLRKHPQIFSDLSARFHRKWQLYNGLMLALEYKVTSQLLFGSDFPLRTTQQALDEFRGLNDWGEGVTLPKFPREVIEDIVTNRPLDLLWPEG